MLMKVFRRIAVIAVLLMVAVGPAAGQGDFPAPQGYVSDFAVVMAASDTVYVNNLAARLVDDTGVELAVVTVSSTAPYEPKEYGVQLFNTWGIGGPEDSGLLVLLAMKEGRVEVEVGYGLEGVLPDGLIGAVLDEYALPQFEQGQFSQGLRQTAEALARSVQDEEFARSTAAAGEEGINPWLTSFVIFLLIAVVLTRGSRRFPPGGGYGGHIPRGRRRLGPSGFPRGSGSKGGFGGGSSGGGGAGRSFK